MTSQEKKKKKKIAEPRASFVPAVQGGRSLVEHARSADWLLIGLLVMTRVHSLLHFSSFVITGTLTRPAEGTFLLCHYIRDKLTVGCVCTDSITRIKAV